MVLRLPTPNLQKPRQIYIVFGRESFNNFSISVYNKFANNDSSAFFPFKALRVWVFRVGVFRVRVLGLELFGLGFLRF